MVGRMHVTDAELRTPLTPVVLVLGGLGVLLLFGSNEPTDLFDQHTVALIGLLVVASSGGAWMLSQWRPLVGRWFAVLSVALLIVCVNSWLRTPGTLALMAIPPVLALPLISLPAAGAIAAGESLALAALLNYPPAGVGWAGVIVALVAIGATLAASYALYHSVREQRMWVEEYSERSQRFVEETRSRRAELEQALSRLTHANRQLALAGERMATLRTIAQEAQRAKMAFVSNVSHDSTE